MNFIIPLNSIGRKSGRILWIALAFNGAISFAIAMGHQYHGWFNLVAGFYGAALFAGAVLYLIFGKARQLIVDENGLRGQINWRRRLDLSWTDITKVAFVGQHLKLQINDGSTQSINLAYLTYVEYKDMKAKLHPILADHGIASQQNAWSNRRYHV